MSTIVKWTLTKTNSLPLERLQRTLTWKQVSEHLYAQNMGKQKWYEHYTLRVAKVERAYDGPEGR